MTIRKIATDETFSASTTVQPGGKIVNAKFSVRKTENDPRFELVCKLDFSACSATDILELATKTCVIDLQRQYRIRANTPNHNITVNPFAAVNVKSAIVDATRSTGTPMQRASSSMLKLNRQEQIDVLVNSFDMSNADATKTVDAKIAKIAPAKKSA